MKEIEKTFGICPTLLKLNFNNYLFIKTFLEGNRN